MRLVNGGGSVDIPDPLAEHVARYVGEVRRGRKTDKRMLAESIAGLIEPVRAVEALVGASDGPDG